MSKFLHVGRDHLLTYGDICPSLPQMKRKASSQEAQGPMAMWMELGAAQKKAAEAANLAQVAKHAAANAQIEAEKAAASIPSITPLIEEKGCTAGESEEPQQKKKCYPKVYDPTPTRQLMDVMLPTKKDNVLDKTPAGTKDVGIAKVDLRRFEKKGERKSKGDTREEADRVFDPKWLQDFTWLQKREVEEKNSDGESFTMTAMFCIPCQAAQFTNAFTSLSTRRPGGGVTSMRRTRLGEHAGTDHHKAALEREVRSRNLTVMQNNMIFLEDDVYANLFFVAYSLLKLNCPLAKFSDMCLAAELPRVKIQVQVADPADEKNYIFESVDMGKHYRTEQFIREVSFFFSEVLRAEQSQEICKHRVFASCIDEATDKVKEQSLAQCVSFVKNGKVEHQFSNIIPLYAQNAETIYNADCDSLILLFGGEEVAMHKAHFGFSSDGASVVCGHKTGVAARYRRESPMITTIHCAAHQQSLCATNASEVVDEIGTTFKEDLQSIYKNLGSSVQRRQALEAAQRKLKLKISAVKKNVLSRWLSLGRSATSVRRNVLPLHKYYTEEKCAGDNAPVLARLLENHTFIYELHAMEDILVKLNLLSVMTQANGVTFRSVTSQCCDF